MFTPIPSAPTAKRARSSGAMPHGRLPPTPASDQTAAGEEEMTAAGRHHLQLYLMTQERAWLTGRTIFAISCGGAVQLIPADEFRPGYGDTVEFVAWPPGWHYRP